MESHASQSNRVSRNSESGSLNVMGWKTSEERKKSVLVVPNGHGKAKTKAARLWRRVGVWTLLETGACLR